MGLVNLVNPSVCGGLPYPGDPPPMSLMDLWSLETTVFLEHSTLLGGSEWSPVFWVNPGISCGTVFLWWILVSVGALSVLGDLHVLADHGATVGS